MNSIQLDFLEALEALTPEGLTARLHQQYGDTGTVFYQDANFATILAVGYDFQSGSAHFNLSNITEGEQAAAHARRLGTRPSHLSPFGWHARYIEGELGDVLIGVHTLLRMRLLEASGYLKLARDV